MYVGRTCRTGKDEIYTCINVLYGLKPGIKTG